MKKLSSLGRKLSNKEMKFINGGGWGSFQCNGNGHCNSSGDGPVSSQSELDAIARRNCANCGGVKNTLCTGCTGNA